MTKTLTEQWRDGTLRGCFYWKLPNGNICTAYTDTMMDIKNVRDSDEVEVLQETPSYVEYKRLQEQLNEANEVIKKYTSGEYKVKTPKYVGTCYGINMLTGEPDKEDLYEGYYFAKVPFANNTKPATAYLNKWGVK